MVPIKGDIHEVKKENNKTTIIINEGVNMANYELDSGLIEFGTAMEDGDLVRLASHRFVNSRLHNKQIKLIHGF